MRNDWKCIEIPSCWERREASLPMPRFSSMAWNAYRGRLIAFFDKSGEVFYTEADRPEGPFTTPISFKKTPRLKPVPNAFAQASLAAKRFA